MDRTARAQRLHPQTTGENEEPLLTIRQVAEKFGVTMRALRFYEARGLMNSGRLRPATGAARNSIRTYDGEQLRQLGRILRAKALGFTLAETRVLLESPSDDAPLGSDLALGADDAAERIARLEVQRDSLDRAIAELKAVWMPAAGTATASLQQAG